MDSKILMERLRGEGFPHVYEWEDAPNTEYPSHMHKGRVSFYVTNGCVTIYFVKGGSGIMLCKGERYDMKPGIEHHAKVGPNGCAWIVGEEVEGDA